MDYFSRRRASTSAGQEPGQQQAPLPTPGARYVAGAPSFENLRAPSSIRIRRLPSNTAVQTLHAQRPTTQQGAASPITEDAIEASRRRSSSAPQRPNLDALYNTDLSRQRTAEGASQSRMPAISEGEQSFSRDGLLHPGYAEHARNFRSPSPGVEGHDMAGRTGGNTPAMHSAGHAAHRTRGLTRFRSNTSASRHVPETEYDSDVIDLLDLVDPEVRTIGTLTNLQNSLFVPDLGGLVNRRPTYTLSSRPSSGRPDNEDLQRIARSRAGTRASRTAPTKPISEGLTESGEDIELDYTPRRTMSITSQLHDAHYAVLPHGVSLQGWSDEDVAELNDHVRHLMHSKREGFKRSMRGFRQYISKPLGLFVFVYATLVTLFGAAWVFGLIGWIYVGDQQDYVINIIDLTLVALFALIGDGMAPFRAVDTYHMCFIAHYHHLTWRLRKEKNLPPLVDRNDLPDRPKDIAEIEDAIDKEEQAEFSVLTPRQQKRLQYHQAKFNKSHTFYKPHETSTHHAFPLRLMIAAVVLLDCHSLLQVALGTCTWSIDYRVRPEALTATILSCSITCNIMAGVMISIGDHKTRKKNVLERIFRQSLTEQALKRMAKQHGRGKMSLAVDPSKVDSEDIYNAHQAVTENAADQHSSSHGLRASEEHLSPVQN